MSDDDEGDNNENLPSADECNKRCNEFAAITGTDTALAMFFLQDRNWDLEASVCEYLESVDEAQSCNSKPVIYMRTVERDDKCTDPEPHRIRVMSWNIDGLDQSHVKTRAASVCKTINKEKPDVVFLQEVIKSNLEVLKECCAKEYSIIIGTPSNKVNDNGEYFIACMLRNLTVDYTDHSVVPFYSSVMCRALLIVQAKVKDLDCIMMTSHLESTKSFDAERVRQLQISLDEMIKAPESTVVIFAGDLNLRDQELDKIGGLKSNVLDAWEETGRRPEARYTWDTVKNDNLSLPYKSRQRFDRMFYRSGGEKIKAVYFELVGFERIPECKRFPSDHWGIMTHFNKIN